MRMISELAIDDFIKAQNRVQLIGTTERIFEGAERTKTAYNEWLNDTIKGYTAWMDIAKYSTARRYTDIAKLSRDAYKLGRTGIDISGNWYVNDNMLFRIVATNLPSLKKKHISVMLYRID